MFVFTQPGMNGDAMPPTLVNIADCRSIAVFGNIVCAAFPSSDPERLIRVNLASAETPEAAQSIVERVYRAIAEQKTTIDLNKG